MTVGSKFAVLSPITLSCATWIGQIAGNRTGLFRPILK